MGLDSKILELAGALADKESAESRVVDAWSAPGEALARSEAMLAQEQVDRHGENSRTETRKVLDWLLTGIPHRPGRP